MDNGKSFIQSLENMPFEELKIGMSRREFFTTLFAELQLFTYHRSGASGSKLSTLGTMSLVHLEKIIPIIDPECRIIVKSQSVFAIPKGEENEVLLFDRDPMLTFIFNQINGKTSIQTMAEKLSQNYELEFDRSLRIVRGLFLSLVKIGVCFPVNNPLNG